MVVKKYLLASISAATLACPTVGTPTAEALAGTTIRGHCEQQYADSSYAGHFVKVLYPNGEIALYTCRARLKSGSGVGRPVERFTAGTSGIADNELLIVLPANPIDPSDKGRLILVDWPAR